MGAKRLNCDIVGGHLVLAEPAVRAKSEPRSSAPCKGVDRRRGRRSKRTAQFNLKVDPVFREVVIAQAIRRDMLNVEFIERCVEFFLSAEAAGCHGECFTKAGER
ncbi:MAG: hypothetical protein EKK41_26805 [Hyphomicrobiales bacterium]|nr:MAG: hypothetical protein EKK41_26805 [Hyphomicrobiales bacterium]